MSPVEGVSGNAVPVVREGIVGLQMRLGITADGESVVRNQVGTAPVTVTFDAPTFIMYASFGIAVNERSVNSTD